MGLFGLGKKKDDVMKKDEILRIALTQQNTELFRELTQDIGVLLHEMHVIKQPAVRFFYNDGGILRGMFAQHSTNPQILSLKSMQGDVYLRVCGMHALGGGMYVTYKQSQLKKPAAEFTDQECESIAMDWKNTDAYELALKTFGIPVKSQQKAALDQVVMIGVTCYKDFVKNAAYKPENIFTFMQVLFNAGITIAMAE